ncbi:response regulator [Alsobacter sp. SYSU BS001988]|jgi:two-component system, response regulator PdtaR
MGREFRPNTIVVVEDEEDIRALAATLFEEADLKVREFERADAAWAHIEKNPEQIAILFTDVNTPGSMDGLTLGQRVSQRFPWIRVIVTSGKALPSEAAGDVTFLPKPWLPLDLLMAAEDGRSGDARHA